MSAHYPNETLLPAAGKPGSPTAYRPDAMASIVVSNHNNERNEP